MYLGESPNGSAHGLIGYLEETHGNLMGGHWLALAAGHRGRYSPGENIAIIRYRESSSHIPHMP